MYLSKIALGLFAIYVIINAVVVMDLSKRLEVTEGTLAAVKEQSTAATMLLLAHVELHELTDDKKNILKYDNYDNLLQILPRRKYD